MADTQLPQPVWQSGYAHCSHVVLSGVWSQCSGAVPHHQYGLGGGVGHPPAPRGNLQCGDLVLGAELQSHFLMAAGSHLPASLSAGLLIAGRCCEPNTCAPWRLLCGSTNPQCNSIWRWVLRGELGLDKDESGDPMMGLVSLQEADETRVDLIPPHPH